LKDSEHSATPTSSAVHHVTQLELAKRQTTLGGPPQQHPPCYTELFWLVFTRNGHNMGCL